MSRKVKVRHIEPGIAKLLAGDITPREFLIALRNASFNLENWPDWTTRLSHFIEQTEDLDPGFD